MTPAYTLQTLFEMLAAFLLIYGLFCEERLARLESRIFRFLRRRICRALRRRAEKTRPRRSETARARCKF